MDIAGFSIKGDFFRKDSAVDVLVGLLNELNCRSPGFFETFSNHPYNHGTIRTYISRNKNDLHPDRPDMVEQHARRLDQDYWLFTNMSTESIAGLIKNVVTVAGLQYGKDAIAFLPGIPFDLNIMDRAYTSSGEIILVDDANYDDIYTCIECKEFVHWRVIMGKPQFYHKRANQLCRFSSGLDGWNDWYKDKTRELLGIPYRERWIMVINNIIEDDALDLLYGEPCAVDPIKNYLDHSSDIPEQVRNKLKDILEKTEPPSLGISQIDDFTEAIRIDPNYAAAYRNRALSYDNKKDYDRAIADYNEAIRLDPNDAAAYFHRGLLYYNKRDYDRVISDYTEAIRIDPNNAVSYNNRGRSYYNKGEYDRAISDYTEAIRIDPNNTVSYNNRGMSYYNKGEYDRAIDDLTEAIRLDPNDAVSYNDRAFSYHKKREYDSAISDYNVAILIDPNDAAAYYNRGLVYENKEDYDRAIADYTEAIRVDPNDAAAYFHRGYAYSSKGNDNGKAVADFKMAVQLDPSNTMYQENLAMAKKSST